MRKITNPILSGFNPDPSIIRVGKDFFVATSTFEWFPGVQIHHSRDLVNWNLIARPLDRVTQVDLKGIPDSCGVWAPCLSYDNGTFYLVYSVVRSFDGLWKDTPNYLVTANDIWGDWSEPAFLGGYGFDGSLFHDRDERKWFVSMLMDHRSKNFFGGIVLQEYCPHAGKLVGPVSHIFEGTPLGCTEGPHLYWKDGFYYLLTAEGGTEYGHAVTLARSKSIHGPYEVHPANPILTSRNVPGHPLQKVGHADLFHLEDDDWGIVFLSGRPLTQRGRCTLGRETCLEQVQWPVGQWPSMKSGSPLARVDFNWESSVLPDVPVIPSRETRLYSFAERGLPIEFQTLRIPADDRWCSFGQRQGWLRLRGRDSLHSLFEQSLVARRIDSFHVQATTAIDFQPDSFQQMAGLVFYYNTNHWHYLSVTVDDLGNRHLQILSCDKQKFQTVHREFGDAIAHAMVLHLRGEFDGAEICFSYSVDNESYHRIGPVVDGSILSDEYVCDAENWYRPAFTGAFVGMCCQDLSGMMKAADFQHFEYCDLLTYSRLGDKQGALK